MAQMKSIATDNEQTKEGCPRCGAKMVTRCEDGENFECECYSICTDCYYEES